MEILQISKMEINNRVSTRKNSKTAKFENPKFTKILNEDWKFFKF